LDTPARHLQALPLVEPARVAHTGTAQLRNSFLRRRGVKLETVNALRRQPSRGGSPI